MPGGGGEDDYSWLLDEFGPGSDYRVDPGYDIGSGGGVEIPGAFIPPGGGVENGPGTETGPGGDAPGSGGAAGQFDWAKYLKDPSGYLKSLTGAGAGASGLLKQFGLASKDGSLDLGSLLMLASLFGGGLNQKNSTEKASQQMQDAANHANELATSTINGAQAGYKPYMDAGAAALPQMQAMVGNNNLAAKFLSQGTPSNMAAQFRAGGPPLTLGSLAKMGK